MTIEEYQAFYNAYSKRINDPGVASAIEKQTKLSRIAKEKMKKRYEIEDKLIYLYHSIPAKGIDDSIFSGAQLSKQERLSRLMELWLKDDPKLDSIRSVLKKSGKNEEIGRLENEFEEALFEQYKAELELDIAIADSRQNLFSSEYKTKLKQFADEGVLLYFLETPHLPILDDGVNADKVIDSLCFGGFMSLKTLFYSFVSQDDPSPSMGRKIADVMSAIDCLEFGQYRSSARTVFSLLESEHKNCSEAMDNYVNLNAKAKSGAERAEKIQKILCELGKQTYFSTVWGIINPIYKDILNSKTDSFIDRNSIIHGDYYSEKMDITRNDVVKLLLLYLNMRMISDHIQNYCEMLQKTVEYLEIHFTQELKKGKR